MEEEKTDLETRYQKLATEFAKVRSQVVVLKTALREEQAKNSDVKSLLLKYDQQKRKHSQEMESLMFRNDQLTKRISVLQQELQISHVKKGKTKGEPNTFQVNMTVLDEELQKKILENAQLVSNITDKDLELNQYQQRNDYLEKQISILEEEREKAQTSHSFKVAKLQKEIDKLKEATSDCTDSLNCNCIGTEIASNKYWQDEAERWKTECEVLKSRPNTNEELSRYYELKLSEALEVKHRSLSETKSLWAENAALTSRLEDNILKVVELESELNKAKEDYNTTIQSYKGQLDAMTEHLAAQNDKITTMSDENEAYRHMLQARK